MVPEHFLQVTVRELQPCAKLIQSEPEKEVTSLCERRLIKMDASSWRISGLLIFINFFFLFLTSKVLKIDAMLKYKLLLVQYFIVGQILFILVAKGVYDRIDQIRPRHSVIGLAIRFVLGPVFILATCMSLLHLVLASTEPKRLAFIAGYAFGFTMYVMGIFVIFEIVFFVFKFLSALKSNSMLRAALSGMQRTDLQGRLSIGLTFVLSCICFFIAVKNSAFPDVVRVKIPIKGLPVSFNNTVIVQLSDMHIGVLNGKAAVEKVVTVSNSLSPDIIAITGDTAEGHLDSIRDALVPLQRLKSKFGAFISTGNHDYYGASIDKLMDLWKSLGLIVLHNSNVKIENKEKDFFNLVGIDDIEGKFLRGEHHGPFYERALKGRDSNVPTILLSHRPSVSKKAMMNYGNIQLALSGHTHGGQFLITGLYHYLAEPYFNGLYQFDADSYVYVSTGVFYWAAPLRLYCKGEISSITLIST